MITLYFKYIVGAMFHMSTLRTRKSVPGIDRTILLSSIFLIKQKLINSFLFRYKYNLKKSQIELHLNFT